MKCLIFDTETTGLIPNGLLSLDKQPEVIEFYGCRVDLMTGAVDEELDILIKPRLKISDEITKITGIDNDMVASSLPFVAHADAISNLIHGSDMVIAHNLSYDKEMIDIEFRRLGKTITWPEGRCTVEQTVHFKGHRLTLSDLHQFLFEKPFKGAHRAKVDVEALTRCCVELVKNGELL